MCYDKRWAGLTEMMALSSVIGHVIYSVYPTCSPLFHGPIVPRMGTPPTSCYIMWTYDSALDNNGPFQPNHFVPLFVYSEKERTGNVCGNRETWKSETPPKTEKAKEKECPSTSKWIAENNVQPVPFYGKKNKWNKHCRGSSTNCRKPPCQKICSWRRTARRNLCSRNSLSGEIC